MSVSIPMPAGLAAFLRMEGPDMWHEFAIGVDFADPRATIDLLLASDMITQQADCDRATAALLLAKSVLAGFHRGQCPPGFDETAARAFVVRLSDAMVTGVFRNARFALPPQGLRLVRTELGPRGPLPLPPLAFGSVPHRARCEFASWRPVSTTASRVRAA